MSETLTPRKITKYPGIDEGFYIIGSRCNEEKICKYTTMARFKEWLETGKIPFSEPSKWLDPYERLFYNADYQGELGIDFKCKLLAFCMTPTTSCEAAWKVYKYGNGPKDGEKGLCVQLVFDYAKLRKCLAEAIAKMPEYKLYEGKVTYRATKTIRRLRKIGDEIHNRFFHDKRNFGLKEFLSLMLIKRPAYQYENEIRFFLTYKDGLEIKETGISIEWHKCLNHIVVDEDAYKSSNTFEKFEQLCKKHHVYVLKKHNLYDDSGIAPAFANN